jgi:hypothetical protein
LRVAARSGKHKRKANNKESGMALALTDKTLVEAISSKEGSLNLAKQAVLVIAGIAALAICAKISIPMWPRRNGWL